MLWPWFKILDISGIPWGRKFPGLVGKQIVWHMRWRHTLSDSRFPRTGFRLLLFTFPSILSRDSFSVLQPCRVGFWLSKIIDSAFVGVEPRTKYFPRQMDAELTHFPFSDKAGFPFLFQFSSRKFVALRRREHVNHGQRFQATIKEECIGRTFGYCFYEICILEKRLSGKLENFQKTNLLASARLIISKSQDRFSTAKEISSVHRDTLRLHLFEPI